MEQISIGCGSTCDLSPDGNLDKYGSPMKSGIGCPCSISDWLFCFSVLHSDKTVNTISY